MIDPEVVPLQLLITPGATGALIAIAPAVTNAIVNAVLSINNSSPAKRAQAIQQLSDFVTIINNRVTTGQLPAAQGQALTASLNSLIALIRP